LLIAMMALIMRSERSATSTFYRRRGKRLLDLVLAVPALAVAMPAMGLVALGVAVALGRPVIFVQQRPGLGGRTFRFYKFRTMTSARDTAGELKPDDERLTGIGRVLRTLSLDELPQLWHVVRGDMSLVGPRPLLVEYLDRYSPRQARRHEVLPGITGWAQVNGRNALTWEQKFEYDVWYVDNVSFALDIRILLKTCTSVARRRGIPPPTALRCRCSAGATYDGQHCLRSHRPDWSGPSRSVAVATTGHGYRRPDPSLESRTRLRYRLHSYGRPDSRAGRATPHPARRAPVSPPAVRHARISGWRPRAARAEID
jgi:sugar transferase EpsL